MRGSGVWEIHATFVCQSVTAARSAPSGVGGLVEHDISSAVTVDNIVPLTCIYIAANPTT